MFQILLSRWTTIKDEILTTITVIEMTKQVDDAKFGDDGTNNEDGSEKNNSQNLLEVLVCWLFF